MEQGPLKVAAVALLGCILPAAATASTHTTPRFEPADCMFAVPNENSSCGYVHVPESRHSDNTQTIKLAVKIFHSRSASPAADPIVILQGGPGNPSLFYEAQQKSSYKVEPFLGKRDVVIVDQRGNGFSKPSLDCPQLPDASARMFTGFRTRDEIMAGTIKGAVACREYLTAQGIRMESYNGTENAADFDDVRKALGYKQWNLLGESNGARLALTIMRDRPQGVRSAYIGSVTSPSTFFHSGIAGAETIFKDLFQRCVSDANCNSRYPNLEDVFNQAVEKYNKKPLKLKIVDPLPNSRIAGATVEWLFTGGHIYGLLYGEMYSTELTREAPKNIYAIFNGDTETIKKLVTRNVLMAPAYLNFGQLLTMSCLDDFAFETPTSIDSAFAFHPGAGDLEWGRLFSFARESFELCAALVDMTQANFDFKRPVISDIPTLIFNGDLDTATPPDDAIAAAATLKNSQLFIFKGVGHNPMLQGKCPTSMIAAFYDAPMQAVDNRCMASSFGGVIFK